MLGIDLCYHGLKRFLLLLLLLVGFGFATCSSLDQCAECHITCIERGSFVGVVLSVFPPTSVGSHGVLGHPSIHTKDQAFVNLAMQGKHCLAELRQEVFVFFYFCEALAYPLPLVLVHAFLTIRFLAELHQRFCKWNEGWPD